MVYFSLGGEEFSEKEKLQDFSVTARFKWFYLYWHRPLSGAIKIGQFNGLLWQLQSGFMSCTGQEQSGAY
jgi:hypothetical protein